MACDQSEEFLSYSQPVSGGTQQRFATMVSSAVSVCAEGQNMENFAARRAQQGAFWHGD
ncbi:MAG: hypothetical protein ABFD70_09700 [Syntrophaceae bacterium]